MDYLLASIVLVASVVAGVRVARPWGHFCVAVGGLALLVVAGLGLYRDAPWLATGFQLMWAALIFTLAHYSWRGSRAAWALLPPSVGSLTLLSIFAAPKLRDMLAVTGVRDFISQAPLIGLVLPALLIGGTVGILRAAPGAR